MLPELIKLIFTINPANYVTGVIQENADFGIVLDMSFDDIPLKGHKNYSLYNDMVISIRNARRENKESIEVTKSDLDTLKQILIEATQSTPLLNRKVSFMLEVIDNSISNHILDKNKKEEITQ